MTIEEYRKILSMAIDNEIVAHDFYKSICEKVKDNNLRVYLRSWLKMN